MPYRTIYTTSNATPHHNTPHYTTPPHPNLPHTTPTLPTPHHPKSPHTKHHNSHTIHHIPRHHTTPPQLTPLHPTHNTPHPIPNLSLQIPYQSPCMYCAIFSFRFRIPQESLLDLLHGNLLAKNSKLMIIDCQ